MKSVTETNKVMICEANEIEFELSSFVEAQMANLKTSVANRKIIEMSDRLQTEQLIGGGGPSACGICCEKAPIFSAKIESQSGSHSAYMCDDCKKVISMIFAVKALNKDLFDICVKYKNMVAMETSTKSAIDTILKNTSYMIEINYVV